jgi:hypothetical protein
MTTNLYYNKQIGKNLVSREDGADVWNDDNDGTHTDIHYVLNILGIKYKWTDSLNNSIPVVNVGSLHHRSDNFSNIIRKSANKYKKCIILSTQEPWQKDVIDKYLNLYDNIFLMDCSTNLEDKQYHERYMPFPFLFVKMFSLQQQQTHVFPHIDYDRQICLFNCLMANWRADKHILYSILGYTLSVTNKDEGRVSLVDENIVTYRAPTFDVGIEPILKYYREMDNDFCDFAVEGVSTFKDRLLDRDVEFRNNIRAHPRYVYDDSCISLICESMSGSSFKSEWDDVFNQPKLTNIDSRAYITEKSILPIMNKHPWITYGEVGFHSTMESYGILPHDELFNLGCDNQPDPVIRGYEVVQEIIKNDLDYYKEILSNPESDTRKKIERNNYVLFNMNSILWKQLKTQMETYLTKFKDYNG